MIKKYRIYIDSEKDSDICGRLESIPRPLRGEFIRTAIRRLMELHPPPGKEAPGGVPVLPNLFGD